MRLQKMLKLLCLAVIATSAIGIIAAVSFTFLSPLPARDPNISEGTRAYAPEEQLLYNPAAELIKLRESIETEPANMVTCHAAAHQIGHEAYETLGAGALDYTNPMCGGGYFHGVIEQAFLESAVRDVSAFVHETCSSDNIESCLHGVGHGIHNVYGNIPQSLELCGEIATSHTDCYDGVFMDAFDPEGATIDTKYALAEAIQICASTTKIAQPSCYFYVPRAVPQAEVTSIIELCTSAEIGNGWSACAEGSGVYFMKYVSGFNKAVATSYCQAYTDSNMETLCLDGIADYEQYGGLENTKWH